MFERLKNLFGIRLANDSVALPQSDESGLLPSNTIIPFFLDERGFIGTKEFLLKSPEVAACVRMIANAIGSMDWAIFKNQDGFWIRDFDSEYDDILAAPSILPAASLKIVLANSLLLDRVAYLRKINRRVRFVNPAEVTREVTATKTIKYKINGKFINLIEVLYSTVDGENPEPPAVGILSDVYASIEFARMRSQFFSRATGGILSYDDSVTFNETLEKAADVFKKELVAKSGMPIQWIILPTGVKYDALKSPLKDTEILAHYKITQDNICSYFGVPASRLTRTTDSEGLRRRAEEQAEFLEQAVKPVADKIGDIMTRAIIPPNERAKKSVRLIYGGVASLNPAAIIEAVKTLRQFGIILPSEARALLGLNPNNKIPDDVAPPPNVSG